MKIKRRRRGLGRYGLTVICECANHTDHQSSFSNSLRPSIRTIIGMFPKYTIILFMYADNVLDFHSASIMCDKRTRLCSLYVLVVSGMPIKRTNLKYYYAPSNEFVLNNRILKIIHLPLCPYRIHHCI